MSHYTLPKITYLGESSGELTLEDLRQRAQIDLEASEVVIEFSRDVLQKFVCPVCHHEEELYRPVGSVPYGRANCKNDGHLRTVIPLHSYSGEADLAGRGLDQLGLPLFDVFTARAGEREIGYLPYGDAPAVLGRLAARLCPATSKPEAE